MKWTTLKVKPEISKSLTASAREMGVRKQILVEQLLSLDTSVLDDS